MSKLLALFLACGVALAAPRMLTETETIDVGVDGSGMSKVVEITRSEEFLRYHMDGKDAPIHIEDADEVLKLDPTKCYGKLLGMFSLNSKASDEPFDPVAADKATEEMCPGLKTTCCESEAIRAQLEQFKSGYQAIRQQMFYHRNITAFLLAQGVKPVEFKVPQTPKDAEEDADIVLPTNEDQLVSHYLFAMESAYNRFDHLNHTISKYYSGFVCGFCAPSIVSSFSTGSPLEHDESNLLYFRFNMASYNALTRLAYDYYGYVTQVMQASYFLLNIQGADGHALPEFLEYHSSSSLKDFIQESNNILGKLRSCMDLQNVAQIRNAQTNCLRFTGEFFDFSVFAAIPSSFKDQIKLGRVYIRHRYGADKLSPKDTTEFQDMLWFTAFNTKSEMNWASISKTFDDKGMDMTAITYNEKLWYASALRAAITGCMSLLAMAHLI